ncbi:transcriptional regulator GcvA [Defluviimonas sp. WL0024]|uniref:Transcriptional regulator GcvA n=2 Tax=Albidovulum TaxID=205889 RepID=A0ABT3IYD3_9RHOB|nr:MULTISPECIES: transcriptional regulator GcvA [Defluviimonas]MCU9848580.1 transcriptional regulator GcvA [Defluviimonas sp. WL0024]MCW3780436.1 transcriptional regulator GcvA [Defluviimonas salinarum]
MSDRTPPLTALRAFEAAARHLSFAKAAAELNVTPAALSFQIRTLEEHLGQPVFRRLNRAVELTEAGRALQPGLAEGFAALSAAWRAARRLGEGQSLTVTAGPAFTAKWLAPRLFDFARAHPGIELRFAASLRLMDLRRDEVDVAIRFGTSPDDGLCSVPLIREWLSPMMVPELARRMTRPEDLGEVVLLHQDDVSFIRPPVDWAAWFAAAGLGEPPSGGPRFSQADHAIDAALSGAGVILGRFSLAHHALRSGQLVAPFEIALTTAAQYRFLCLPGTEERPHVRLFRDWLLQEAAAMSACEAGKRLVPSA